MAKFGNKQILSEDFEGKIKQISYDVVGNKTGVCVLTLDNGFEVLGSSSCLRDECFDKDLAYKIALERASNKLFELHAYHTLESEYDVMKQEIEEELEQDKEQEEVLKLEDIFPFGETMEITFQAEDHGLPFSFPITVKDINLKSAHAVIDLNDDDEMDELIKEYESLCEECVLEDLTRSDDCECDCDFEDTDTEHPELSYKESLIRLAQLTPRSEISDKKLAEIFKILLDK